MHKGGRPPCATHIKNDGTYWKCTEGQWYWWRSYFGWCGYIGIVNGDFLASRRPL